MKPFTYLVILIFTLIFASGLKARAADLEYTPSVDASVRLSSPDSAFGNQSSLDALYDSGTDPTHVPQEVQESFLKFDLSDLPKGKYITSAKLVLTGYGSSNSGYSDIRLRRVLSPWDESVTWNTRPSYSGESEANLEVPNNTFPNDIDLTGVVDDWYTGKQANYGLVMRAYGDGDYAKGLFSAEDAHASAKDGPNPPRLKVTYSPNPPTPKPTPTPSATTTSAGAATTGAVSSPSGSSTGSSQSNPSPPPLPTIIQPLDPCQKDITSLNVGRAESELTVSFTTGSPVSALIYYSLESKTVPPRTRNKTATDYTTGTLVVSDPQPITAHRLILPNLKPGENYYFTILAGSVQECEHSVATQRSIVVDNSGTLLSRLSRGTGATSSAYRTPTTTGIEVLAMAASKLVTYATDGKPLPGMFFASLLTGVLTCFTLGVRSIMWVQNGYIAVLGLPHLLSTLTIQKKRTRGTWGRVLSSLSMHGIKRALITIYDTKTGKVVDKTLSDERGLFGFLVDPGVYRVFASHPAYGFPPVLMPFGYQGTPFKVENLNGVIQLDIPMDPIEFTQTGFQRLELMLLRAEVLRLPLVIVSLAISALAVFQVPSALTILALAIFLALGYVALRRIKSARYCMVVTNDGGQPLPFSQIRFKNSRGYVVARKVTNQNGQLCISVPASRYLMEITALPMPGRTSATQSTKQVTLESGMRVKNMQVQTRMGK